MLVITAIQAAFYLKRIYAQQAPSANKAPSKVGLAPQATTTLALAPRLSRIVPCVRPDNTVTALQPPAPQANVLLATSVRVAPVLMTNTLLHPATIH